MISPEFDTKGKSVTLDMWGMKADIYYPHFYSRVKEIIKESGMTALNDVVAHWPNKAFTLAIVLEESLFSVHYYPEHCYLSFDIYTCGESEPMGIAKRLDEWLRPEYTQVSSQTRGVRNDA